VRRLVLVPVLVLVLAAPAEAGVRIEPGRVVVEDDGASALIERKPFRITFRDGAGATVLRQLAGPLAPGASAGSDTSAPGGFGVLPGVAAYAPLAFEVGGERGFQHPGGLWTGNMLTNGKFGAVHFPTEVTEAAPEREGVKLTLATTDPLRKMVLRVQPDRGSALRVIAELDRSEGVAAISDSFESGPGESFHGFGGRHNATDQRGNDFYNWIEEEAFNSGPLEYVEQSPGSGGDKYLFPNGPTQAYYVQNIFVSSRPYGFLVNRDELTRWRMASDREDAWQVTANAAGLDYTVAVGDGKEATSTLTSINGRHRAPPDWGLGAMVKRNVQQGNSDPARQQQLITADLAEIEKRDVPLTGYSYESWDTLPAEFVRATNAKLRARGIHAIGYVRSYVNDEGNFDPPGTFQDAVSNGYVAKTPGGAPFVSVAVGPAALIDFTNPEAVAWWERRKIRKMLDLGFDGFMQDFGEQVVTDMRFHDGSTGAEMHNRYPKVFHRVTREILDRYEREHPERGELWMYTRSGFSGRPGSAAYESANFPGDESTDWSRSNGIGFLTSDMLNRGLGGSWGFTTGIGGYFDNFTQAGTLSKELFIRWSQWTALTPIFRVHNSCCTNGTRMPWSYDEETYAAWLAMAKLHDAARPLLEALWEEDAEKGGLPLARPLWMEHPDDAEARRQDQEWMLGRDVLVAPVVEEGATKRRVYFPSGCWRHGETGERFSGPGYAEVAAPLGSLPYFLRCEVGSLAAAAERVAPGGGAQKCLPRTGAVRAWRVGPVRVSHRRARIEERLGQPRRKTSRSHRYCVTGGGEVRVAFAPRGGPGRLIATTAPGYRSRGIGRGSSLRSLRRAYPGLTRLRSGLYRTSRVQRQVFGVKRGRVRFVAALDRRLIRSRTQVLAYLRLAGL
jgi:alpha-D-xyloside xylohydrolase